MLSTKVKKPEAPKTLQDLNPHLDCLTAFTKDPQNLKFVTEVDNKNSGNVENIAVYTTIDGRYQVAFGNKDNNIAIYDLKNLSKEPFVKIPGHTNDINKVKYYRDLVKRKDLLLTASCDLTVRLWDISNGEYKSVMKIENCNDGNTHPTCLLFEDHTSYIITGGQKWLTYYQVNGKQHSKLDLGIPKYHLIETFYHGKNIYVIVTGKGGVYLYNWRQKQIERKFVENGDDAQHWPITINEVNGVVDLIEGDYKGKIRIWDMFNGTLKKTIVNEGEDPWVYTMTLWTPNTLLAAGENHKIRLFSLEGGNCIKEWQQHKTFIDVVKKIKLDNGDEFILSSSEGGTLLWKCD